MSKKYFKTKEGNKQERRCSLKKKTLLLILSLLLFSLIGCLGNYDKENEHEIINIWSLMGDFTTVINKFVEAHPDFAYEIHITDLSNANFTYEPALYDTLVNGSENYGLALPDIYPVEIPYAVRYTQGDVYQYAAVYKELGIDTDTLLKEASIPQYYIDLGTNPDGELVALGYLNTAGAFIYRRSIAEDVWGTDDPSIIQEKIGPGWDKFFKAAADLRDKGYGVCSGIGDIWSAVEYSADLGWLVDDKLYIDPKREEFLDFAKKLIENDYTNNTDQWSDEWSLDMSGQGEKEIFGFFGPYWLVNYILMPFSGGETIGEGTYGDWAICDPPVGFFRGGTVILAHKNTKYKEAVGEIIKWITLDISEEGYQNRLAKEDINSKYKEMPLSTTIAKKLYSSIDFLGGQNIYEAYISAGNLARGGNLSMHDQSIDSFWQLQVREYADGKKSREQAIADFKHRVAEYFDYIKRRR